MYVLLKKAPAGALGGVVASEVKETRPVHCANASFPILVTELGMVTVVRPVQLRNASDPM